MSEPVAWMASNELLFSVVKDEIYHIPLYTQRELTDEEIEEVFQENIRQPNFMMLGDTQRFARAILKKANEK